MTAEEPVARVCMPVMDGYEPSLADATQSSCSECDRLCWHDKEAPEDQLIVCMHCFVEFQRESPMPVHADDKTRQIARAMGADDDEINSVVDSLNKLFGVEDG